MNREAEIERCARDLIDELFFIVNNGYAKNLTLQTKALVALDEALALPKQEPVAWVVTCDDDRYYVDIIDDPQLIYDIKNHGATYEPLYTSPNNHIVDSNKMINYVPMTDDEWETLYKTYEQLIYDPSPSPKYIEAEVVRRMKEQGLI